MNRTDYERRPTKYKAEPDILGHVDQVGTYYIESPEHHVLIDERNFFTAFLHGQRLRAEKESIIEGFSKFNQFS